MHQVVFITIRGMSQFQMRLAQVLWSFKPSKGRYRMNAMDRRKFIKDMAIALAGTTAGLTANSCSLIRAGYSKDGSDSNPEDTLRRFQKKSKGISDSKDMPGVERYLQDHNVSQYMIKDAIISLMAISTFGNLEAVDQKHPAMQKMVRDTLPLMDRAIMSTTSFLESLSGEERKEIQTTMVEHPEILTTFQVEFDKSARNNDIAHSSIDHFNSLFNKATWRIEHQDPSVLIDELVTLSDKSAQKSSVAPEERRKLGSDQELSSFNMMAMQDAPADSTQPQPSPEELYRIEQYERWKKVNERGGHAALWGLVQFGLGALLMSTADDPFEGLGGLGLFVGMTGGAIITIVGIIMAIVGSVNMSRYD